MFNKKYAVVLVIVFIVVLFFVFSKKSGEQKVIISVSPEISFISPTPSVSDSQQLTPLEVRKVINGNLARLPVNYGKLTKPATCRLTGGLKFLKPTLYENLDNYLTYTGIDSPARQIKWSVSPTDDLRVGPNLTANLILPDGSNRVDVTLPENQKAKQYILTASMTYGRLENGDVKIYEVKCSGNTMVEVAF